LFSLGCCISFLSWPNEHSELIQFPLLKPDMTVFGFFIAKFCCLCQKLESINKNGLSNLECFTGN
jgi:hypothetical protein